MNKFIRVTAIVGAALVALALLLLLISIPLQPALGRIYMRQGDVLSYLPIFPVAAFVNLFLLLGCTVPMIFCAGKKKVGIWLEILVFVALVLILPIISSVLSTGLNVVAGNYRGSAYMAAYSIVNTISGWFTWISGIGRAITLAACGMSITYKKLSK